MKYPYKQRKVDGKRIDEHRYLMQKHIGRPLLRGELVHHINGDKMDNRLENLMIMTPKEHNAHHNQKHPIVKKCLVCGSEYVAPAKHRERSKTCSQKCKYDLLSVINRTPKSQNSMYRVAAYPCQVKLRRNVRNQEL